MSIKKNDKVLVISGNARGHEGKVLKVFRAEQRVIVEGVNIIKRHTRPSQKNPKGGIIQKEAPIHISDVMVLCPKCNQPTRIGHKKVSDAISGRKTSMRVCKQCEEMFT